MTNGQDWTIEPGSLEHRILAELTGIDNDELAHVLFGEGITYEQRQELGQALERLAQAGLIERTT